MTAARNAASITVGSVKEYQWKAALTLPAQGTYCYRRSTRRPTCSVTRPRSSPPRSRSASTSPFSFDVMGDWGQVDGAGNNADQAGVLSQIAASGARFLVTVGDNGYPNGSQINYGDLQQTGKDTSAIFGPAFWTMAAADPIFTAAGNHGLGGPSHTDITTWTAGSSSSQPPAGATRTTSTAA